MSTCTTNSVHTYLSGYLFHKDACAALSILHFDINDSKVSSRPRLRFRQLVDYVVVWCF